MTPVPVLFLIFNRPDTTARVFEAIRAAQPARLYVAADGPRCDRPGEAERCEQARRIATTVDWPCEVETRFHEANLGCREAVSSAIDWFFASEEEGIILEDDCVPASDFFPFCRELLERFRDDERVMAVCGSSYAQTGVGYRASYYFSYYADMWGWATWRRAWRFYDRDLSRWPAFKARGGLQALSNGRSWHEAYWTTGFDATHTRRLETWDLQWVFAVIENGGLACYPVHNLVTNIGFRSDATHTVFGHDQDLPLAADRAHQALAFPLVHPRELTRSALLERQIEAVRLGFGPPLGRFARGRFLLGACVKFVIETLRYVTWTLRKRPLGKS
jgi:hypothetical protein